MPHGFRFCIFPVPPRTCTCRRYAGLLHQLRHSVAQVLGQIARAENISLDQFINGIRHRCRQGAAVLLQDGGIIRVQLQSQGQQPQCGQGVGVNHFDSFRSTSCAISSWRIHPLVVIPRAAAALLIARRSPALTRMVSKAGRWGSITGHFPTPT